MDRGGLIDKSKNFCFNTRNIFCNLKKKKMKKLALFILSVICLSIMTHAQEPNNILSPASEVIEVSYEYDNKGRPITIIDERSRQILEYDSCGNLSRLIKIPHVINTENPITEQCFYVEGCVLLSVTNNTYLNTEEIPLSCSGE